jgi:hypothetical protein
MEIISKTPIPFFKLLEMEIEETPELVERYDYALYKSYLEKMRKLYSKEDIENMKKLYEKLGDILEDEFLRCLIVNNYPITSFAELHTILNRFLDAEKIQEIYNIIEEVIK